MFWMVRFIEICQSNFFFPSLSHGIIICTSAVVPPPRCFGMLLSPGQKVSNSNMHLLDMVSHSLFPIIFLDGFGLWKNVLHALVCFENHQCFIHASCRGSLRSRWGRARMGRPTWSPEHGTPTWLPFSHSMKTRLKVGCMKAAFM